MKCRWDIQEIQHRWAGQSCFWIWRDQPLTNAIFLGMAGSLRNSSEMAIRIISVKALQKQNPDVDQTTRFLSWNPTQILQTAAFLIPYSWFGQCLTWLKQQLHMLHVESWCLFSDRIIVFLVFVWKRATLRSSLLTWVLYEKCQNDPKWANDHTAGSMSNVPSVLVSPVYATPSPLVFPSHIVTPKPAGWAVAVPQLIIWLRRRPKLGRVGWGIHWASFSHGTPEKRHGNLGLFDDLLKE